MPLRSYNAGPKITIWATGRNGAAPVSNPPVCEECLEERCARTSSTTSSRSARRRADAPSSARSRKNFSTAEVRVVRLAERDFDEDGQRKPAGASSLAVCASLARP